MSGKVRTVDTIMSDKCPASIESLEASVKYIMHVPVQVFAVFHFKIVSAPEKCAFVCLDFVVDVAGMAV